MKGINNTGITRNSTNTQGSRMASSGVKGIGSSHVGTSGGFEKGQTLKGEIIDLRGKDVKIQLNDGRVISARLESNAALAIGQKATFSVASASLNSMALKVLTDSYTLSQEATVDKALEEAGLPKTERNISAVRELLQNALSIDKNSIHALLAEAATYKNASMGTLALMKHYNIPMNDVTTTQLEAYRSYEHRLISLTSDLADSLNELFSSTATNTREQLTAGLRILNMLTQNITSAASVTPDGSIHDTVTTTASDMVPTTDTATASGMIPTADTATASGMVYTADTATSSGMVPTADTAIASGMIPTADTATASGIVPTADTASSMVSGKAADIVSPDSPLSSSLSLSSLWPDNIKTADAAPVAFLAALKNRLQTDSRSTDIPRPDTSQLLSLFQSVPYKKLIKQAFLSRWTLKPHELQADSLNKLYSTLSSDLKQLKSMAEHDESSQLSTSIKNTQDNLDFMRTLNNLFTYVQLPSKMTSGNTHAELYVYTKKERLRNNPDHIRVLLHLDMTYLGPTDCHLELSGHSLTASFYTADKLSCNLISDSLELLHTAAAQKGYIVQSNVTVRDDTPDYVKECLSFEEPVGATRRYTFDIRA